MWRFLLHDCLSFPEFPGISLQNVLDCGVGESLEDSSFDAVLAYVLFMHG